MKKWSDIQALLNTEPEKEHVRKAQPDKGIFGDYLPAQVVCMYLNQVFGPDGWSGILNKVERLVLQDGSVAFESEYSIRAIGLDDLNNEVEAIRSNGGCGVARAWFDRQTGEIKPPKSEALDTAYKASISDGLKRAAKDFGLRLGLQLYLNEQELAAFH